MAVSVTLCKQLGERLRAGLDHQLHMFPGPPTGQPPLTDIAQEGEDQPSDSGSVALSYVLYRTLLFPSLTSSLSRTLPVQPDDNLIFNTEIWCFQPTMRYNYSILINHQQIMTCWPHCYHNAYIPQVP